MRIGKYWQLYCASCSISCQFCIFVDCGTAVVVRWFLTVIAPPYRCLLNWQIVKGLPPKSLGGREQVSLYSVLSKRWIACQGQVSFIARSD